MSELTLDRCIYLRNKYPNCYPIILKSGNENIEFNKCKLLVRKDANISQLMSQIRLINKLNSKEAYFLFVNNMLINTSETIESIYMQHKESNGFLYIIVKKESTFG